MKTVQDVKIKNILIEAVKRGASDLHFSVGNYPAIRLDGRLVSLEDQEIINADLMQILVDTILSEEQKKVLETKRELILTYDFENNLRFKINIFYQRGFISVSLRHIPSQVPTIKSLGLNQVLAPLANINKGLVIISGPFGSGRSTTAAAMIEEINQTRKEYIITIEDPIEYVFVNKKSIIEQREVGRDTRSFKEALRYFQEEDGDVLFLEEMQDPEIIPLVLEIAHSSALVISTISADSAAKTVARILDSFQSFDQERIRDLLATALKAVVCQKLLPKAGGGILAFQEILIMNEAAQSSIISGNVNQLDNIVRTSRQEGMISFDQAIVEALRYRKISVADASGDISDQKLLNKIDR